MMREKQCFKCFLIVTAVFIIYLIVYIQYTPDRFFKKPSYWKDSQRKKLILFVTTWFGKSPWLGAENTQAFLSLPVHPSGVCPVTNCEITYDLSKFNWSDLIVAHGESSDILPVLSTLKDLRRVRPKQQRWVWNTLESPRNIHYNLSMLDGMFDWTQTYRLDSDILHPYNYYFSKTHPDTFEVDYALNKTKLVAWLVSNSNVKYRSDLVRDLTKHGVKVDIFGEGSSNGTRVCGWSCPDFFKPYKFYLAFENSYCKDYITEKYWFSLLRGMVPIVIGGANYSDPSLAVPKSYINALDFSSVKDLADYILYLDQNHTHYNKYLSWRKKYKIGVEVDKLGFCSTCAKINSEVSQTKREINLSGFWSLDTCKDIENITRTKLKI